MNTQICPTITALTIEEFNAQIEKVSIFAKRIHIDLMDGIFAPTKSIDLSQVWWPEGIMADIHVMFQNPSELLDGLIDLKPNMVIVHAEAVCDVALFASRLREHGVKTGLALLPQTSVSSVDYLLPHVQQVLIFSGNLGYQGGSKADLSLLEKIDQVKQSHKWVPEIAWDGGINDLVARQLTEGGVDVLNVGSFIHSSTNPTNAYNLLTQQVTDV